MSYINTEFEDGVKVAKLYVDGGWKISTGTSVAEVCMIYQKASMHGESCSQLGTMQKILSLDIALTFLF